MVPSQASRLLLSVSVLVVSVTSAFGVDPAPSRSIAQTLAKTRMTVDWESMELGTALEQVRRSTDVPFVIAPALRARDDDESKVSLTLSEIRTSKLLELLADAFDVEYLASDGYVLVTTPADAVRRTAVLRVYDVSALLLRAPDFTGPEIVLRGSRDRDDLPSPGGTEERRDPPRADEIVDLVLRTTAGDGDWDFDGVSIDAFGSRKIVVRHTPRKQLEIARTLAVLGAL